MHQVLGDSFRASSSSSLNTEARCFCFASASISSGTRRATAPRRNLNSPRDRLGETITPPALRQRVDRAVCRLGDAQLNPSALADRSVRRDSANDRPLSGRTSDPAASSSIAGVTAHAGGAEAPSAGRAAGRRLLVCTRSSDVGSSDRVAASRLKQQPRSRGCFVPGSEARNATIGFWPQARGARRRPS